jgi:hypothetical protein
MDLKPRFSLAALFSILLIALIALPPSLRAQQEHVVRPADIHDELVNTTESRRQNRDKVVRLFSTERSEKALKSVGMDPGQVRTAVASLSDAELAVLAARSDKLQEDFAAGRFSDRELLIILVAIAALILVIVAV